MKPTHRRCRAGRKAAAAALTFLALTPLTSNAGSPTIPPGDDTDEAREAFCRLRQPYYFRTAETPLLLQRFLEEHPSSTYVADARLMLADWYFYNGEYALALQAYNEIPDGAFSGDVRDGMLYRKALSMVKSGFYNEARRYFASIGASTDFGEAARFYLAYIDYVNGKYDDAYRQFQAIRKSGPQGAEAEYYLNQIDYRNGDYRKVANTTERLLSTGRVPEELLGETMRVGGLSYFKTGDKVNARNLLSRYASLAGDGAEIAALYSLATIYYDEGDYDRALPLFTTVTDYPGDLAQSSWLYIGQIYMARDDARGAALAFDKAARESWDPTVAETAAYNLAVTSTSGMALPFSDSAAAMESFIDTYPSSPHASALSAYLANAYYGRRDYDNALRQVNLIADQNSTATRTLRQKILYQMGVARLQQGDSAGAVKALSEAASPDREVGAQAALWLGDAYYARKDYRAAAKAYTDALNSGMLGENTALARYNLGYADMKLRDYRKAETAFRDALALKTLPRLQQTDARLRYADCLYYNGKYTEAMAIFKDIRLDGGQDAAFAMIREADILGKDGKVNEKISILETVVDNPDAGVWRTTALSRLADAYSEKGNDRKAAELYSRMLDSEGSSTDRSQTFYSLAANADNLYNAGDTEAAYAAYRRLENSGIAALYPAAVTGVMRTASDLAERWEYAAKAAALPGISAEDMDEALFIGAEAGLSLDPGRQREALKTLNELARSSDRLWAARAAVTLGERLTRDGDPAQAEAVLLSLVDGGSDDSYWLARGYIALADAYSAQDKDYLARLYLETLRDNYPGNEKDILQMINSRLKNLGK